MSSFCTYVACLSFRRASGRHPDGYQKRIFHDVQSVEFEMILNNGLCLLMTWHGRQAAWKWKVICHTSAFV